MDIGAYLNIENLQSLMERNGIYVPRLRGLRLMEKEEPFSMGEIRLMEEDETARLAMELGGAHRWKYACPSPGRAGIRWDRIHGKKRRALKFRIKNYAKAAEAQYAMWNQHAGKKGVLYIHTRCYMDDLNRIKTQPWFLGAARHADDGTYHDIYAKLEETL